MSSVLDAITAGARRSALERAARTPRAQLERAIDGPRSGAAFIAALRAPGIRVIAECKRRSPSRGILRDSYDAPAIARGYEQAGAAAISVLTEPSFFDGSLDHLRAVRAAVSTPVLRKDFVVTAYQVVEAAASGADAVLLIVASLDDVGLRTLGGLARELGLAALVEVHDREELDRALDSGADLVGVNSRNLKTLNVDAAVLSALAAELPGTITAVAESGLRTAADLASLHRARYDAFLIGERFMTEADPGRALADLLAAAEAAIA
jgi:indole-3-glycerol phosphate synthase